MVLAEIVPVQDNDEDIETLIDFMHKLAKYDNHTSTEDKVKLKEQLFYPGSNVRAFFSTLDGNPIGFILFYECFTVYQGERGLYVPGAFIEEYYRGQGHGKKLFKHVAQYALDNGFSFMNWIVEADNDNAKKVYEGMGAQISEGWSYVRIPPDKVKELGSK